MMVSTSVKVKVKYGLRNDPSPEQLQEWVRSTLRKVAEGQVPEDAGRDAAFNVFPDAESCLYASEADNIETLLSALSQERDTPSMPSPAASFINQWVKGHVHNIPGLEDVPGEISRLREQLARDASAAGVSVEDIEHECGDLDDVLITAYENVRDPELGFWTE